ncbi:glycosyltransferase family 2 protein [Bacteroides sp. RTP21281st1_E4_RTP21281_210402]|uniref:glycosyltransferase family 2 protein n=1 Tax=unclassified Bacteroides TaxID=2646097 RepID=UPI0034A1C04A
MSKQVTFSIIIPVYNAEGYLKKAIESIIGQSYESWQLVLVDDGSSDNSGVLCDIYSTQDARIQTIHQENRGVAAARNVGIHYATGEYLLFCDSDDFYERGALSLLKCQIETVSGGVDVICYGLYSGTGHSWWPVGHPQYIVLDENYIEKEIFPEMLNLCPKSNKDILPFLWNKLYKREIIEKYGIHLNEKYKKWEDKDFLMRYMSKARNIMFIHTPLYHYVNAEKERLSTKYIAETMLIVPQIYRAMEDCFGEKFELSSFYSNRYYFDIICRLIFEAIEQEGEACRNVVGRALNDSVIVGWIKGITPKNIYEKRIQKGCMMYKGEEIYAAFDDYYKYILRKKNNIPCWKKLFGRIRAITRLLYEKLTVKK